MAIFEFDNIEISGIASAVPKKTIYTNEYSTVFGKSIVEQFVKMTGIKQVRKTLSNQTASDLGYIAAKELINKKEIDKKKIGVLIFVTLSPDYRRPSTSCVLHARLGLDNNCVVFDVGLGCSAFVYGAHIISSLMYSSDTEYGLLIVGETMSKLVNPKDRSAVMMFGDAGAAILFEKTSLKNRSLGGELFTDGNRYKSIIVPAGGFRNMNANSETFVFADGNERSLYDVWMDGSKVFEFAIHEIPHTISEYIDCVEKNISDYDFFIIHQANRFIHKQIQKRLNIDAEKIPICLDRYGNTSAASIPLTISDKFGEDEKGAISLLTIGFGVGFSWGIFEFTINCNNIYPIIESDEYYEEGVISTPDEWE